MAAGEAENNGTGTPQDGGSLVPFEGGVVRGLQAFRRGDAIIYTVRGEPREIQELISHLGRQGINELVALISHEAQDEPEPGEPGRQDRAAPEHPE